MFHKFPSLVILTSVLAMASGLSCAQDKVLSEELKQHWEEIEKAKEMSKEGKEQAQKANSQEWVVIWENIDPLYEKKATCFNQKEEIDIRICILKAYEQLAQEGNFVAQDYLAQIYLGSHQNKSEALRWMKAAYDNPKTPNAYKEIMTEQMTELEKEMTGEKKSQTKETPFSPRAQKHKESAKENLDYVKLEKRKAELLQVQENLILLDHAEQVFVLEDQCFNQPTENQMEVCYMEAIKKLADEGNFFSQHQLGNIYENSFKNKELAIKWYETALSNPKTPDTYKPEIESDLKRAKESKHTHSR